MEIAVFWAFLFALLFVGVPIAFAISAGALALMLLFIEGMPIKGMLVVMVQRMFGGADSFPLLAIPLFFLAGALMDRGGLSERLVRFASALVGWVRGGLLMVVILAEMLLAAVAGSPSAVAAAIGSVVAPSLKEKGYEPRFSTAVIAAGATVGPIIPPSILLVIFGSLANVSIAKLFIGGIVPGILMGVALMALCYLVSVWRNYPPEERTSFTAILRATGDAILPLAAPGIILGGIFSGVFTATESAVAAVLYAIIVGKFVYKALGWKEIVQACYESALGSARIMFIIAMASFVGWVLAREQVPQTMAEYLLSLSQDPLIVLLLINALFLVFGCFIEGIAIMIILLPTIIPVVEALGIDLVFFGVMIVINLSIGSITPPVGTCLVVASSVTRVPFDKTFKDIAPFVAVLVLVLLLTVLFPQFVLGLVNVVM